MNVEGSYFIINNTEEIIGYQVIKNKKIEVKDTKNNYQELIKKQKEIQDYIEQVKNNELEYSESDFEITSTIHYIHQKINSYPKTAFSDDVNYKDIENQLKKAYILIHEFPEDFGLNYRSTIENICSVHIDRYQMLHIISLINLDLTHHNKKTLQLEEVYI